MSVRLLQTVVLSPEELTFPAGSIITDPKLVARLSRESVESCDAPDSLSGDSLSDDASEEN